jgi:hypothetical protein
MEGNPFLYERPAATTISLRDGIAYRPTGGVARRLDQLPNVSFTPSTTWAVVLFNVSQVFSPTCRMVSSPPWDAFDAFWERGFDAAALAMDFLDPLFEAAFRAGFLAREERAVGRFFVEARFADFFLAAMAVSWGSGRKS